MEPPLRRCFGKAGILKDGPSESAPDDPPLETGEGPRTVKDTAGVEVMIHPVRVFNGGAGSAEDPNSAGSFRDALKLLLLREKQVTSDLAPSAT